MLLAESHKLLYNAAMESTKQEEIERIIRMLRTAMRLLGFTNREIERRLSYTPSYLTRLFSGQIELRFEHIVDIVQAMGMTVDEFFRFSYPERGEKLTAPAERLEGLLEELRPTPPPPENPRLWREEEFERTVVSALRKVAREEDEQREAQRKELEEKLEFIESTLRELARDLPPEKRKPRPVSKRPARPSRKKQAPA